MPLLTLQLVLGLTATLGTIAALVLIVLRKRRASGVMLLLAMAPLAIVALLLGSYAAHRVVADANRPYSLYLGEDTPPPRKHTMPEEEACMSHLRSLTQAMETYLQDSGGRYPPADRWVAALRPILQRQGEDERVFSCPDAPKGHGGYALNAHVAGRDSRGWPDPNNTVVFFETDSPVGAVGGAALLPAHPHHRTGDCYGFADFHHLVCLPRTSAYSWRWDPNKPPPPAGP